MIAKNIYIYTKRASILLNSFLSNTTRFMTVVMGSLLITLTCQANGLSTGFYAGLGMTNFSAEEKGVSSQGTGATVIGGYKYSEYLSSEISIFNIGDHKELGMKGNGASIGLIASYPALETIDIFAEFGGMSINLDIDEAKNLAYSSSEERTLQDGRDSSLYYSVGAKYKIDNWSFILKTTSIDLDADMTMVSAQIHYHF
jgi:hypothetical protein